ncbi:hypothetical protein [Nocardiopsis sp. N85]|uniref:hypothetical protein n=1 Tax=Nocardiopsis sp. N85 TaxID=3029400 RepID=UPI00406C183A
MSTALPRSATAVALLADIPSTGHVGEVRAQRFAMHGDGIGERSAAFVAFARQQTAAGRKIVALYPAWRADDAARAVNFARGALRTDHIAGIPLDLSPLALSLVADQLTYLAPYLPPGMVAALCNELPRHLLAGAWLKTVSGLETIPTSMRQHMGSYAPAVSFLAYCAPTPRVERLRPSEVARRLPFRPVQPVQLLCSTPDPTITGIFDDNLPQAIQPVATRTLPAQPLGPEYWGTAKYVEFVALSAHPQALAYAAGAVRASACSWCGEPMTGAPCPFCAAGTARSPLRTRMTPDRGTPDERPRRPDAPVRDRHDSGPWSSALGGGSVPSRPRAEDPPRDPRATGEHAPTSGAPARVGDVAARAANPMPDPRTTGEYAVTPGGLSGGTSAWADPRRPEGHRSAPAPADAHHDGARPARDPRVTGEHTFVPGAPAANGHRPDVPAPLGAQRRHGGEHAGTPGAPTPDPRTTGGHTFVPGAPAANGNGAGPAPVRREAPGAPSTEGPPTGSGAWAPVSVAANGRRPDALPSDPGAEPPLTGPGATSAMPTGGRGPDPARTHDHERHGDHHLTLEAEALPPITVDEAAWHSTVDGRPHDAPRPPTGPRPPDAPGPQPASSDRSENPPLAGRAPRPEAPRTYSR